jgi:multiple antibiotic resistance protein
MIETSWVQITILLIFVLDPFGNVPVVLSVLKSIPKARQRRIIAREMLIGLGILALFLFFGESFLKLFHLETDAVRIAGAVIFFVIGIKMIFPGDKGSASLYGSEGEPFVVPIAMPLVAGPSALATLLVLSNSHSDKILMLTGSLLAAWVITSFVMLMAPFLFEVLKSKGLMALERLMGMLLLMLAVQMFIDGIRSLAKMQVG